MKLTVVSPTFNEAQNVGAFAEAVAQAMQGCDYELLIVDDDSPDRTWEKVEEISRTNPRVRLLHRTVNPGLSPSVIDGFAAANSEVVACIDADLQHDPTILPAMLQKLEQGCDVVVGSRYVEGGGVQDWSLIRRFESWVATKLAHIFLGVELHDPMSGFFMMRRSDFLRVRQNLDGSGFKILLEILAALRSAKVCEVPYTFRPRTAGESKLSGKVVLAYLQQLWRLSRVRAGISSQFVKFLVVGGAGVVVNLIVMSAILQLGGNVDWRGSASASAVAALHNYLWNNYWSFRDRRHVGSALFSGAITYLALSTIGIAATTASYSILTATLLRPYSITSHASLLGAQLVSILVGTLLTYNLNRLFTWRKQPDAAAATRTIQ